MSESTPTRPVWYVLWAVIAAIVALNTAQGFLHGSDDYQPTCDHQRMRRGDMCIGSGGGSYDEMVDEHHHNDQILFVVSCPLTLLFTGLALRGRKQRSKTKKAP